MSSAAHRRLLRAGGVLLFLLGIVHLLATPHISALIRHSATAVAADELIPPMLLNHILVGVLLLPLGYLLWYAAPQAANRVAWARNVVRVIALTVATLPITLFALMGGRYFDAPLFILGTALVVIAALTLLLVAFTSPRASI